MDMIREQGYSQVTISQICKKAKVAKGTVYLYFSSKKDILFEILASINREMFAEQPWERESDAVLKLQEFLRCYVRVVTAQGYEFSLEILKIILEQHPDPHLVEADRHWNTFHAIIKEGQEANLFREMDTGLVTDIMQDFLFGSIQRWCTRSGAYSIEEYVINRFQIIQESLMAY